VRSINRVIQLYPLLAQYFYQFSQLHIHASNYTAAKRISSNQRALVSISDK